MDYPIKIRSKREFVAWVRTQLAEGDKQQFYMRMFDRPYIHTAERFEMLYGPFEPFQLPQTVKDAEKFWDRLMEDEITVFMISEFGMGTFWCVAKLAVWNALRQLHIFLDLGNFREVTYEEFGKIVGDKNTFDEILEECRFMGISFRNAKRIRTADGEFLLEKRKAERKKAKKKPARKSKAKKPASRKALRPKKKR